MTFKDQVKKAFRRALYELEKPRGRNTFNGRYLSPDEKKALGEMRVLVENITGRKVSDKELDQVSGYDLGFLLSETEMQEIGLRFRRL